MNKMSEITDFAIVTVYLLDWPSDMPNMLALKVPLVEEDFSDGFVSPNRGRLEDIANREIAKIDFGGAGGGDLAWEYRGIRWNMSADRVTPDLLPGEHWMPNGAADVNALFTLAREKDEAETAQFSGGPR